MLRGISGTSLLKRATCSTADGRADRTVGTGSTDQASAESGVPRLGWKQDHELALRFASGPERHRFRPLARLTGASARLGHLPQLQSPKDS